MRVFQYYNPFKIAKYVKTLFKGRLYIQGIGIFEFDMGRILPPKTKDHLYLHTMAEINRHVYRLQLDI